MKLLTFLKKLTEDDRKARAKSMGYDPEKVWYHANTGGIEGEGFDDSRLPANDPDRPFNAHWFSSEPSEFAAYPSTGNTITPVHLKLDPSKEATHDVWRKVARYVNMMYRRGEAPEGKRPSDLIREILVDRGYTHAIRGREPIDAEELKRTGETSFKTSTGGTVTLKWEKVQAPPRPPEFTDEEIEVIRALRDAETRMDQFQTMVMDAVRNDELTPEKTEHIKATGVEIKAEIDRLKPLADAAMERGYADAYKKAGEFDSLEMYDDDIGHVTGYSDLEDFEKMSPEIEDVAVLDPSIIRSIHAEFNPDEDGSNKIMSSLGESQPTRPPAVAYHATFPDNRDNIRMHGLDPKYSDTFEEGAVFFATGGTPDPRMDIWKANLQGLDIDYDPTQEGEDSEHWWYTHQLVVPDRLTLVQKGTG